MILLDVNVVLAAQRDDHPHHDQVRPWFDELMAGDFAFTVPAAVCASYLRLTTNRRVFTTPASLEEASDFLVATTGQPHHLRLDPGPRHLTLLRRTCDEGDATGDLLPDAVLAAVVLEHGCTVATLDRDCARFPSVSTLRPGS